MSLSDVYIYQDSFSKDTVNTFLREFLPGFKPMGDVFAALDSDFQTTSFETMLDYVIDTPEVGHCFYFKLPSYQPYQFGMINLCADGSCSMGIAVPQRAEQHYVDQLKAYYASDLVFICYEVPPPSSREAVMALFSRAGE